MDVLRLKNLGPKSAEWLQAVGIHTLEDLEQIGSVIAYQRANQRGFNHSLNLLFGFEAALQDAHWTVLSKHTKTRLKLAARLN